MAAPRKQWIKLWLSLLENERFALLTDAERWGYLHILMVGESVSYTYANEGQLRLLVGHSYRYCKKLRAVGLLDDLTVYQGRERQSPTDPTGKERHDRWLGKRGPETPLDDRYDAVNNGTLTDSLLREKGEGRREIKDGNPVKGRDAGWEPPIQNPSIEIATVVAAAQARGWQVTRQDHRAVNEDFRRNPGRLAEDYVAEWDAVAARKPVANPWAVVFAHSGKDPENATAVELRTRRRLEVIEATRHKAVRDAEREYSAGAP